MSTEAKHVAILVNQTSKVCIAEVVYESPLGPPIAVVGDSRRGGDVPDVPFVGEHLAVGRAFIALGQGLIDASLGGLDDALARREAGRLAAIEQRRQPKLPDPVFQTMVLGQQMIDQVLADEKHLGRPATSDREDLHRQVMAGGRAVIEIPDGPRFDAAVEMYAILAVRYSVEILGVPTDDALSFVEESLQGRVISREQIAAALERTHESEPTVVELAKARADEKPERTHLLGKIAEIKDGVRAIATDDERMRFSLEVINRLGALQTRIDALTPGKGQAKVLAHFEDLNRLVLTEVFQLTDEQVNELAGA